MLAALLMAVRKSTASKASSGRQCGLTTRSSGGSSLAESLKVSRIKRRILLRSTALENNRLDTIMPSRGWPDSLGRPMT